MINWFKRLLQWREIDRITHESLPYSEGRSKMPLVKTTSVSLKEVKSFGYVRDKDSDPWLHAYIVRIENGDAVCVNVELFPPFVTVRYNQWVLGEKRPLSVDYNFMRLHKDA